MYTNCFGNALRNLERVYFEEQYFVNSIKPRYNLPFAGKYFLGGKLANLNHYRGIADPFEVSYFDKKAIILDDKGKGEIDLNTDKIKFSKSFIHNNITEKNKALFTIAKC